MTVIDFPQPPRIDLDYVRALPPLVTMPVAAAVLGMTRQNATALARAGKFAVPILGTGRGARVARRDLEALLLPANPPVSDRSSAEFEERIVDLEHLVADLAAAIAGPATTAARIHAELTR